ncbi:MAG: amidohydrolase family protein [bacterium]|nr:amidohydrolase family protein [bacterium]
MLILYIHHSRYFFNTFFNISAFPSIYLVHYGLDSFRPACKTKSSRLQKILHLDSSVTRDLSAWYILKTATINGAKALDPDTNNTGSIAKGKEADIILLSKKRLGMAPYVPAKKNLAALIVYSADARAVDTVFSDGKIVVENGKLVPFKARGSTYDEETLALKLSGISAAVSERAKTGKTITKIVELNRNGKTVPYWYQYYSVRKKDRFDVTFKNTGNEPVEVRIAMSALIFGGTAAPMMNPKVKERFPASTGKHYFDYTYNIEPSQRIRIEKTTPLYHYKISFSNDTKKDVFRKAKLNRGEQILFLVQQEVAVQEKGGRK